MKKRIREFEEEEDEQYESILDKIDSIERRVLNNSKLAPEYLLLDKMSYEQLLYERGIKDNIGMYHGYILAVVQNEDFEEIIRFI